MEYEHIDGPDGVDIRVPTDDGSDVLGMRRGL